MASQRRDLTFRSSSSSSPEDGRLSVFAHHRKLTPIMTRKSAVMASPLQHSFPPPSSEPFPPTQNDSSQSPEFSSPSSSTTPSRVPRQTDRPRAQSRSSSMPVSLLTNKQDTNTPALSTISPTRSHRGHDSSVKHLTCYWWKSTGNCRFSEDDCLYAHHDTGKYASAPRQLIPGQPAMAGRRLEQATRNFAANKSTVSLCSLGGSRMSRPSTPAFDVNFPVVTSSPLTPTTPFEEELQKLSKDNEFLHSLIDQNAREKNVMMSTIENLQVDKKSLQLELNHLETIHQELVKEHDSLMKITLDQQKHLNNNLPQRNPFGVIGTPPPTMDDRFLGKTPK